MNKIEKLKISLHQINTKTGDLKNNYNKIRSLIDDDHKNNVDISVFPETAISGYCCGALFDKEDFILEQERYLKKILNSTPYMMTVVVGYVSFLGMKLNGYPRLHNSIAVINNGNLQIYDKQLLAGADHHEDKKYFDAGQKTEVIPVNTKHGKINLGVLNCEDFWYNNHIRNLPQELIDKGAEILIVPNQSYFYYGKQEIRRKLCREVSKQVPVIYVNSYGIGDILKNIILFDGRSMVAYNGMIKYESPIFKEDSYSFSFESIGQAYLKEYTKYDEIWDALCFEQKEMFSQINIPNAQVHVSGGIDSAVIAAIVSNSMGPEHSIFITNPSNLSDESIKLARKISNDLGVKLWENPIQEIYDKIIDIDKTSFEGELSPVGKSTIQATLRSCLGLYACHRFNSGIVSTFNFVENVLGWSNFHDIGSIGVHAPIGDLTKTEIYEFSNYINKKLGSEIIPAGLFNGQIKPAAELPDVGKKEDPIDYYIQSGLCPDVIRYNKSKRKLIRDFLEGHLNKELYPDVNGKSVYEMYDIKKFIIETDITLTKTKRFVFKSAQSSPVPLLTFRSRGFSNRETLINHFKE